MAKRSGLPRGPKFPGPASKSTYTTHMPEKTGQDKAAISRRAPRGAKGSKRK